MNVIIFDFKTPMDTVTRTLSATYSSPFLAVRITWFPEKSISEIVLSGSHYHSYDSEGTGSGEITQEWVDNEISSSIWTLTYTEFIAPLIKSVQELSAKVTELENQISGYEWNY